MERDLPATVVIADMEAGLEHLSIGTLAAVDLLLVVVLPAAKALMTADRTYRLARELGIPEVAFLANRVRRPGDHDRLAAFARDHGSRLVATIPEDDEVRRADAGDRCILDTAPGASTVLAVARLADLLEARLLRIAPGP